MNDTAQVESYSTGNKVVIVLHFDDVDAAKYVASNLPIEDITRAILTAANASDISEVKAH
jgi:hypothetical protein